MDVQQNFAVIGLGEFGIRVCEMLAEGGGSVVAFDHDAQAVDRVKKFVPAAMVKMRLRKLRSTILMLLSLRSATIKKRVS